MKRWIWISLLTGTILLLATLAAGWWGFDAKFSNLQQRGYLLQQYTLAFEYYREKGQPAPDSLEEMVNTYNASPSGKESPITSDHSAVQYRPAGKLSNGPYLVLVDVPQNWIGRGNRCVLYAYPDGEIDGVIVVTEIELPTIIERDDRRREVGARVRADQQEGKRPASNPDGLK